MKFNVCSMELIFELVLQVFGELIVQLLFELGFRALAEPFSNKNRPANVALSVSGYLLFGLIAGGLSLLIVPRHLALNLPWRIANLVLTPVLVGAGMNLLGNVREKKDLSTIRLDKFSYGFCFALAMAVVRFIWA